MINKVYDSTKPYSNDILSLIRETWKNPWCQITDGPVIKMHHNHATVDHTDGIGTKGHYHWKARTFKDAVTDALAMNINDLAMMGAIPFKLQNHIYLPEDDHGAILEIVRALADECKRREISITGGETSIHTGMGGMELSVTLSGIAQPPRPPYQKGDVLVGLKSSGIHANGTTLVTKVLGGRECTVPTKIYYERIMEVYDSVTGLNHITGGAYTKIKPTPDLDVVFRFEDSLPIFYDLFNAGVDSRTMYKTFNCGYGFVVGVPKDNLDYVLKATGGSVIGEVVAGQGKVRILSAFDGEVFEY